MFGAPLALTLAGALSACADAEPRELGFTQSAQDLANVPTQPFFEEAAQFVGRWEGTAEDTLALTADGSSATYRFPSGSTRILVELTLENGDLTGAVTFGEGAPLPPATDPDAGYPEGVAYDDLLGYQLSSQFADGTPINTLIQTHTAMPPFEGFSYELRLVSATSLNDEALLVADGVAALAFSSTQPLTGWCELQTPHPVPDAPGQFSCVPHHGGTFEVGSNGAGELCDIYGPPVLDGCLPDFSNFDECYQEGEVVEQVNCDKLATCGFCTCEDPGCFVTESNDRLTLRRIGDELVGLLENANFKNPRGLGTPLGEVRLQRVQ